MPAAFKTMPAAQKRPTGLHYSACSTSTAACCLWTVPCMHVMHTGCMRIWCAAHPACWRGRCVIEIAAQQHQWVLLLLLTAWHRLRSIAAQLLLPVGGLRRRGQPRHHLLRLHLPRRLVRLIRQPRCAPVSKYSQLHSVRGQRWSTLPFTHAGKCMRLYMCCVPRM